MMRGKWRILLVLAVIIITAYVARWIWWGSGSIMAISEWRRMLKTSKVMVKEVPSAVPFWAVPFSFLSDDNLYYRCEYYRSSSATLFSAQTYQGNSYTAQKARIEWNDAGAAIVYLDDIPILKCSPEGYWMKARE